ncbi:MAG: TolC family protein [Bacteroidota bacterium]
MENNRKNLRKIFKNFFSVCIGLTLILSAQSNAQVKSYTLDEAITTALENNHDTKIAKMNIQKASAAVDEAYGNALPSLDVSANLTHFMQKPMMFFPDFGALLGNATYNILFNENVLPRDNSKFAPIGLTKQSFALNNSFETKVQLTQVLFNSAVLTGIGASKIYQDVSKEQLKSTIAKTILDVKKAFYGVLLTKSLSEITSAGFANAQDNYKNVKAMFDQGMVSEYDALQADVQVENFRPTVIMMENNYKNAKEGLKILMGIEPSSDFEIKGEFEYTDEALPQESELVSKALSDNLDLNTMNYKRQVDDAMINLYSADYWPSLAAFGNYSYAGSSDDFKFSNYSSSMVGVSLSLNLFKGMQTKAKVEQAKISHDVSEEQYVQLKSFIILQVKSKLLDVSSAKSKISTQDLNVKKAQMAYDISKIRYQEGKGIQLEIQNNEIALRQAKMNRIQSIYEYIVSKAELDQLLGQVEAKYFNSK